MTREELETENESLRAALLAWQNCSVDLNHKLTVVGDALQNLFADYQMFANSGDAGHWSLEDQPCGQQALAALELLNPTTPETKCTESP